MPFKLADATEFKPGSFIIIDGVPCVVKKLDKSKSGKHGAAKCRIEASGLIDGKKKIVAVPGSERFGIPLILKKRGQVLSVNKESKKASVMDLESFETIEVPFSEDLLNTLEENLNVEYWDVEGQKIIKRII
ncbi:MAG: translation initiation factor IF-5A [archaeon]